MHAVLVRTRRACLETDKFPPNVHCQLQATTNGHMHGELRELDNALAHLDSSSHSWPV